MTTLTFDTYDFIENLKSSGMEERQAKAVVDGLKKVNLDHVVSKDDVSGFKNDLHGLEVAIKDDISRLEVKIESIKTDMLKWFIPLIVGQYLMILGLYGKILH